jgi:hypothetical protein
MYLQANRNASMPHPIAHFGFVDKISENFIIGIQIFEKNDPDAQGFSLLRPHHPP